MTPLEWATAKDHFDTVRKRYQDLEGVPGVSVKFALRMTFDPLAQRFNSGERTDELYREMCEVK